MLHCSSPSSFEDTGNFNCTRNKSLFLIKKVLENNFRVSTQVKISKGFMKKVFQINSETPDSTSK